MWNLEFTAEGDSTKGKVWQHHQLAPEHTQLKPLQMCLTAEKHQKKKYKKLKKYKVQKYNNGDFNKGKGLTKPPVKVKKN